ncbi:MAG TPA: alpha/beta hydrolase [Albitalea sp.]|nr:alpha/beta hydrolase [Albitalea sp.]
MELQVQGKSAYAYTGGKPFDASLPCIVFIHGAIHDHSVWTLLARWFAHHGHAVLAVDLPGHSRSAGPPLESVEALADWVLALLTAAGATQPATLVGHSMGSLIALEAAARGAERIDRLVMVATAYPMKVSDTLLTTGRDAPLQAIELVNALSFSTTAAKPSYPGPGTWLHGSNRELMRRVQASQPDVNLFHHDFGVCNRYAHGIEAAAEVRCPVSLILGERDQMTSPKATRDIAAALSAKVQRLPGGHSLMQESPDAVLNALRHALV